MNPAFWQLPGPRRFLGHLTEERTRGRSTILACPNPSSPAGLFDAVSAETGGWEVHPLGVDLCEGVGGSSAEVELAIRLWDLLGLPLRPGERRDVSSFARHPQLGRLFLTLDARSLNPDSVKLLTGFVASFAAATRDLPRMQRAVWLVQVSPLSDDLGAAAFDAALPSPDVGLALRWWWGVLDRLDVAVWVAERIMNRTVDPVVAMAVPELCGPDLALAEDLLAGWTGALDELDALIASRSAEWPGSKATVPDGHKAGIRPAPHLVADWAVGAVESWAGDVRTHLYPASRADPAVVRARVWLTQVAEIFPLIELERARLAGWASEQPVRPAAGWERVNIAELEIGRLWAWIGSHQALRVDRERRDLLRWLVDARNKLAHREPLEPSAFARGRALVAADRQIR